MKNETLKLCYYASELYESKKLTANQIYELLTKTKNRQGEVAKARQLVAYFLYNHYNLTLKEIAKELNLANHTSIIYQIDKVYFSLRTDKRMKYRYDFMQDIINGIHRTVIRNKVVSKAILQEQDKEFIRENLNKGYSISYFSDVLNKHKNAIQRYLSTLKKDNKKIVKLPEYSLIKITNNKIDY